MELHTIVITLFSFLFIVPQIVKVSSEDVIKNKVTTTTMSSYGNGTFNGKPCNPSTLDECWKDLPATKEPNIPTTSKEVEIVCNAFKIGMDCVESYSKSCLNLKQRQQVKSTVRGAHETFSFVCTDEKFRAEFLSHAQCYKRISKNFDGCSSHFIKSLKKADSRGTLSVCCIRLRFMQCVTELARLHCTKDAERFLIKMAETLSSSNMRNKNASEDVCFNVRSANCTQANSGACSLLIHPSSLLSSVVVNFFSSSSNALTTTARHFGSYFLNLFKIIRDYNDDVWMSLNFGEVSMGLW